MKRQTVAPLTQDACELIAIFTRAKKTVEGRTVRAKAAKKKGPHTNSR